MYCIADNTQQISQIFCWYLRVAFQVRKKKVLQNYFQYKERVQKFSDNQAKGTYQVRSGCDIFLKKSYT